jgi:hypothetical protein
MKHPCSGRSRGISFTLHLPPMRTARRLEF